MRQAGKITYRYSSHRNGHGSEEVILRLTLVSDDDEKTLQSGGIRHLRLRRIARLTKEAADHGVLLGYEDLSMLLLTSLATLKRDVSCLEAKGLEVLLRGRRKKRLGESGVPCTPAPETTTGFSLEPVLVRQLVQEERIA
jgi:hypothetical protein